MHVRQVITTVAVIGLGLFGLTSLPPQAASADAPATWPTTVSADALPTVQINGVVWKQVMAGNVAYAGGSFSKARPAGSPAGSNEVTRNNILAYNVQTGDLITSFAPSLNGQVYDMAVTPDGSKLVVVGDFTTVDSADRNRVAVFDLPSGTLSSVAPNSNGNTKSVAVTNSTIYVGGYFSYLNSTARARLGAFDIDTGATLPFSVPVDNGQVQSIVVSPDASKLVFSGNFTSVGGSSNPGYGLAMVNASTGAMLPLPVNSEFRDAGPNSSVLRLSSDNDSFYGVGWVYGAGGNAEGTFRAAWSDGSLVWIEDCHGDTYDVASVNDVVYTASHKHYCGNSGGFPQPSRWDYHHSTAFTKSVQGANTADIYGYPDHPGTPRPSLLEWFPQTDVGTYTGQSQAVWSVAGNSKYVLYGGEFPKVNGVAQQGLVRYTVRADAPNKQGPRLPSGMSAFNLTVRSLAAGTAQVSWPELWDRDDSKLTYQVYRNNVSTKVYETTRDARFWEAGSLSFTDTGLSFGSTVKYAVRVLDPYGNLLNSGWFSVTVASAGSLGAYSKAVFGDGPSKYWRFDDPAGVATTDWAGSDDAATGAGVRTGLGGAMINDDDPAAGFNGTSRSLIASSVKVAGPQLFSVEAWFKTSSSAGGKLVGFGDAKAGYSSSYDRHIYLDGGGRVIFGVNPTTKKTVNSGPGFNDGQWHQVVATLGPAGQVLYVDGERVDANSSVTSAQQFDGYWRVGGDRTWAGAEWFNGAIDDVSIYSKQLTAADVDGHWVASGRSSTRPNEAPSAAFASTATDLSAAFDGSASTDADGSIVSYGWDFGDGHSGAGVRPAHTYDEVGAYQVTLTVTDDDGATDHVTHTVNVAGPGTGGPLASDNFDRTVASGWGSADVGGAWTVRGGAGSFSVAGGAGSIDVAAGSSRYADLSEVSTASALVTAEFSVGALPGSGEGAYVGVIGRQVGSDSYAARLVVSPNGQVRLYLLRGGSAAIAQPYLVPDLTVVAGSDYKIAVEVSGTGSTTVAAKVWKTSDPEPAAWMRSATDTTADLQSAGHVAVYSYLPSGSSGSPVRVSFESLRVTVP